MKKGFTLVELLAVIIIVAVIGLITVPMVMGSVENARKAAFETGAQSVLDAAIAYVTRVEETGEIPEGGIRVEDISEEIKNENYISGIIVKNSDGSITLEGLSDGEFCASGTKNNLRVIKGDCSGLDNTPPILTVMLNKKTSSSITIVSNGQDVTSGIYGYSYSLDGINYSEISNNNIYTVTGLMRNEAVKIYVRVYNNIYDGTNSKENLELSMTEKVVEYTTTNVEKPEFKISTTESSASTVKIVEIIYPDNIEGYQYSYILNGKEEIVEGNSARVTILENGELIARIKTESEVIENKLVIAGLDNTGPVGNIIYEETWETRKTIRVEVVYEQTGLPSERYSYDGGLTWTSKNEKVYANIEKLTGKIQVRDVLGNITTKFTVNGKELGEGEELEIGYIDNVKPTCNLKGIGIEGNNGWYISDVNIEFDWIKDIANYCENGECEEREPGSGIKTSTIDKPNITENGTTTVTGTIEDIVGNSNICQIEIKRDGKKPEIPTITVSDGKESGSWHAGNFLIALSGSSSESGITYQYSTDGKNYIDGNNISITEETTDTTYYIKACNGAGICSEVITYEVKLDKTTPAEPIITASDGIISGNWHTSNFTLTFSGSSSLSGVTYQYSTDGTNYTNGNSVNITGETAGTTYYVRACNASGLCSTTVNYIVKLDNTRASITAKETTTTLPYQQDKPLSDLNDIVTYGPSGGTTTCYLIVNNERDKVITNNSELSLGINVIECEATTGTGYKDSERVTIKHQYTGDAECTSGTYQNGTCYFESNQSICGTKQIQVTTKEYSSCAYTVNTCQYGCDSVWNANINCSTQTDYNNCTQWKCTLCKTCTYYITSSVPVLNCSSCNGKCEVSYTNYNCIKEVPTTGQSCANCGSETVYDNSRCAGKSSATCATYGTKQVCSGGWEQKNCSSCKTGSTNECRGGYVDKVVTQTVAASCDKSEYLKYSCPTEGINTNTGETIKTTLNGSLCQF